MSEDSRVRFKVVCLMRAAGIVEIPLALYDAGSAYLWDLVRVLTPVARRVEDGVDRPVRTLTQAVDRSARIRYVSAAGLFIREDGKHRGEPDERPREVNRTRVERLESGFSQRTRVEAEERATVVLRMIGRDGGAFAEEILLALNQPTTHRATLERAFVDIRLMGYEVVRVPAGPHGRFRYEARRSPTALN